MRMITYSAALLALLAFAVFLLTRGDKTPIRTSIPVATAMASDTVGYARAETPRAFVFPNDHGPHPEFKSEWWYYTGNLDAESGRHFGFELTIFRFALLPPAARRVRTSSWAGDQLYMAHFALTDVERAVFYDFERFSRGAAGLAGAQSAPLRVWLEDWSIDAAGGDDYPVFLRAQQDGIAIDVEVRPSRPIVLQGDRGLDQKGPEIGNASYYYSITRLATTGTVTVLGETFSVGGLSWADHEWSTSALGEDTVGWDWFSLQLTNGEDIMFYQLRRADGTRSPFTVGSRVRRDGDVQRLDADQVEVDVLDTWTSAETRVTYPSGWRLRIEPDLLDVRIDPYLRDQELNQSVRYWEGAVRVEGTAAGETVGGHGYVELTGYGDISSSASADSAPSRAN